MNFDKVFSVPQAPGSDRGSNANNHNEVISDNQDKSTESSDNSIEEQKDSDEKEGRTQLIGLNRIFSYISHLLTLIVAALFTLISCN